MSYQIDVQNEVMVGNAIDKVLETAISIALQKNEVHSAAVTVLLTDDNRMRQLNQVFRGLNDSTDVLSFPAGDAQSAIDDEIRYLGDIAISVPIAEMQANASDHSLVAELQLLAVHGVLHLLGYDHLLPEDKLLMWSMQDEILTSLGLHDIKPSEI